MSVFKHLGGPHSVEPIEVYTSHSFEWVSGSSQISGFSINLTSDPGVVYPIGTLDLGGVTNGGMFSYPLFRSVEKTFYTKTSRSVEYDLNLAGDLPDPISDVGWYNFSASTAVGQAFSSSWTADLEQIGLRLQNTGSASGSASVKIYHGTGDPVLPNVSEELGSIQVDISDFGAGVWGGVEYYDFTDQNIIITTTASYVVMVEFPEGTSDNNFRIAASGSVYYDGNTYNVVLTPDDPPTTGHITEAADLYFVVYGASSSIENYDPALEFYPIDSVFVWNVGSNYFGEQIRPKSFKIEMSGVSDYIIDDGKGKLVTFQSQSNVIGNIFYDHGIAIVKTHPSSSQEFIDGTGIAIGSGSTVDTSFLSTINIYEHTVVCEISPTDFNKTVNPSAFSPTTSSVTYNDYINSGSQLPYITTIGFYNDINELIAVGKLSSPITRTRYVDQTIIAKFDE